MRKTTALFLFLFLFAASMNGQNNPVPTTIEDSSFLLNNDEAEKNINSSGFAKEVLSDTSISFSDFSVKRDSISAIKLKKEYSWITNIDSFLTVQKKEDSNQSKIVIKQNSGSSFLGSLFNSAILQTVVWIAAATLVLFIIYKLFLSEGVFGRRSVKAGIQIADEDDTRLFNDYEVLLRKAYGEGNWRFSMRFLFLKTLQKLNKNEMINYAADKTNSAYVKELPAAKREDFASLALYYEYIWYGNVEIEKMVFDSIENKFNNFLNKI
jgi:hypothetical protein